MNSPMRPLGDLNAAMRDLDLSADKIRSLLDEGKLIGFNIAVKETTRKNLRVLTRSIEHYRETGGKESLLLEWPEIFSLILPGEKLFVRSTIIQRSLNCDREHVQNLIRAGFFSVSKKGRRGHDGSAMVTRQSFEAFLKGRLQ
ncbi:MAG TPA: hypothetical protein VMD27_06360 [Candidatus Aquilonibacter sp.]|nr:hypothetical protein [Candidatus Aquilonibacter sp.]